MAVRRGAGRPAGSSKELNLPSPVIQKVCQLRNIPQAKEETLASLSGAEIPRIVPFRNEEMIFDGKAFALDGDR